MSDLNAMVKGVLESLDGAGALADMLTEHGREREAVLLRRRWKAWQTAWGEVRSHVGDMAKNSSPAWVAHVVTLRRSQISDLFRRYIRTRFAPRRRRKPPAAHTCQRPRTCTCSASGLEPRDDCPVHSGGEWPPRCGECGRLMKWEREVPA